MKRLIAPGTGWGLFFWLLATVCPAQDFAWTPGLQHAYADLLKLKVPPARQALQAENPKNGIRIFADDYADMLTLLFADDDRAYEKMANREDDRLAQLRQLDQTSPWARVTQAEVRLHWAFVKLKFGKELGASWEVVRAYKLLSENQKLFPAFLPTYKALGVLHVMLGAAPEQYTWVSRMLGLRGDVKTGMDEIKRAQQDPAFRLEAQLVELMIRAYVLCFSDADTRALQLLVSQQPDNALLHFLAATIQMKNGQSESARLFLLSLPQNDTPVYLPTPIVDNLLGDIYLQKGQFATALTHYQRFLARYRGQNFLKDTYYKQFLCYWLARDDVRAQALIHRVTTTGRAVVESDKAAQKFAENYLRSGPTPLQRVLMRARLSCDGGYADTALAVLRPYPEPRFLPGAEQAEFNYRMGRILQRQNAPEAAIPYFTRAIALSDGPGNLSFGATSALQLGYIYQQQQDLFRARQYFGKALSYRHHEYKNSIDNKARAGLNGLTAE